MPRPNLLRLLRRNKLVFALTAIAAAAAMWHSQRESVRARESRARPLLIELEEFVRGRLDRVRVVPDVTSRKEFAYTVDDVDQLALFREAAKHADSEEPSGHNQVQFEADLILENGDRHSRFLAQVYELEPADLFLERRTERHNPDGSWSFDDFVEIRIPGLGQWMMKTAPLGSTDVPAPARPCPTSANSSDCAASRS
jgi:hypothetical protein